MTTKYEEAVERTQRLEDLRDEIMCVDEAINTGLREIAESPSLRAEYQTKHEAFMAMVIDYFKNANCNLFDSMLLTIEVLGYVASAASVDTTEEGDDPTVKATALISVLSKHALQATHRAIKESAKQ